MSLFFQTIAVYVFINVCKVCASSFTSCCDPVSSSVCAARLHLACPFVLWVTVKCLPARLCSRHLLWMYGTDLPMGETDRSCAKVVKGWEEGDHASPVWQCLNKIWHRWGVCCVFIFVFFFFFFNLGKKLPGTWGKAVQKPCSVHPYMTCISGAELGQSGLGADTGACWLLWHFILWRWGRVE
jgi:hypothetical protein